MEGNTQCDLNELEGNLQQSQDKLLTIVNQSPVQYSIFSSNLQFHLKILDLFIFFTNV